jgi:hypothetical protein
MFVSFTAIEKLGINPGSEYNTPNGIYAYPLSYIIREIDSQIYGETEYLTGVTLESVVPFAGNKPWVNVFTCKGNVVNLGDDTAVSKALQLLQKIVGSEELPPTLRQSNLAQTMWSTSMLVSATDKSDPVGTANANKWNAVFRSIGVDGVVDPGKAIIHENEPTQAVFFSTSKLELVTRFPNIKHSGSVEKNKDWRQTTTRTEKLGDVYKAIESSPAFDELYEVLWTWACMDKDIRWVERAHTVSQITQIATSMLGNKVDTPLMVKCIDANFGLESTKVYARVIVTLKAFAGDRKKISTWAKKMLMQSVIDYQKAVTKTTN